MIRAPGNEAQRLAGVELFSLRRDRNLSPAGAVDPRSKVHRSHGADVVVDTEDCRIGLLLALHQVSLATQREHGVGNVVRIQAPPEIATVDHHPHAGECLAVDLDVFSIDAYLAHAEAIQATVKRPAIDLDDSFQTVHAGIPRRPQLGISPDRLSGDRTAFPGRHVDQLRGQFQHGGPAIGDPL